MRVVVERLDLAPAAIASLAARLSAEELERAQRCCLERDRRRFIVAHARLRQLLAAHLGVSPDAVELECSEHGKPMLAGRHALSGWHFNVSHCDDVAVYALAAGRRVGIDIEAVREVRGADAIAANFFSRRENAAYRALDPRDKPLGFINCWTRKEAFVKALGHGISYSYDRFDVTLEPQQPARILRVDDTPGDRVGWLLESFSPLRGFVAALVTERRDNDIIM